MFKIAIIGRPNVGKSTLFNKLVGRSIAITDDTPGVTRDRKEAIANLGPARFMIIDTAGLESKVGNNSLEARMIEQTYAAIADADLCIFVVDGREGVLQSDRYFAEWLKKSGKKTILIANKCENFNHEEGFGGEYYKLGFGAPLALSAEHKAGFIDLYQEISPFLEEYEANFSSLEQDADDEKSMMQIAIVGRPNAGKSTLLNRIINEDRLVTGPEAGITRDSIAIDYEFEGKKIRFIDTAGIRKKSNITDKLDKLSTLDSFRALRFAQVVILLIDANSLLDHQDLALAGEIMKEGRGLLFAINKIDDVEGDKEVFMKKVRAQIQSMLPEMDGVPILGISAQGGYNVNKMINFAVKIYEQWQTYISTSDLNEWIKHATQTHSPQLFKGRPIKLKYATQIKRRPPTIAVFTNHITPLEGAYKRYLVNSLKQYFDLALTPMRLVFRKSENPFENKREKNFSKKLHKKK